MQVNLTKLLTVFTNYRIELRGGVSVHVKEYLFTNHHTPTKTVTVSATTSIPVLTDLVFAIGGVWQLFRACLKSIH